MLGRKSLLFWVLGVALALRVAAALGVHAYLDQGGAGRFLIAGDAAGYWELARAVAHGEDYAAHDPPRRVMRMPGFPLFIAIPVALFGENLLIVRLALALAGTAACGLVYWLGRNLFDETVGLVAVALTAVSPTMIVFSVLILSETLFAAFLVASLIPVAVLMHRAERPLEHPNWLWLSVATGVLVAAASYVRPTWLAAAPLLALAGIALAKNRRRALWSGAIICGAVAVLFIPWIVRNYQATGKLVVTTLWVGPSLYDGLHPGATGASDMTFYERDRLSTKLSEYEIDRHYRREALAFARENPGQVLKLAGVKLARYWSPWPNAPQFGRWWQKALVAVFFIPVMVFAGVGFWRYRRQPSCWLLALGPIVLFSLVHSVFVASLRYRLPAEYPLCVLSAAGIRDLWKGRG